MNLPVINQYGYSQVYYAGLLVMAMAFFLGLDDLYKAIAYLNCIVAGVLAFKTSQKTSSALGRTLVVSCLVPICLVVIIDWIAVGHWEVVKEMRHILIASAIAYGTYYCLENLKDDKRKTNWLLIGVILYLLIELIAVYFSARPHAVGTTKNPHYLAHGALVCCIFLLVFEAKGLLKRLLVFLFMAVSLILLIKTSSRPAWIALTGGFMILFYYASLVTKKRLVLTFFAILTTVLVTNFGNAWTRITDLCQNIASEERVYIWRDMLHMLEQNTWFEWIFGHGVRSFYGSFKSYSEYHAKGIDFNSPHNFILELLYTQGVAGLIVITAFLCWLFHTLISNYRHMGLQSRLALFSILLLTCNLLFTSIILPFYTSYNLNILGICSGMGIYMLAKRENEGNV